MRISDVLKAKGNEVVTVSPDTTVADLLSRLAEHNVGALIVASEEGVLDGIVSERDVVRQLHERGVALLGQPVSGIMTADVSTCSPADTVEDLMRLMTERRIRHVPVVVDGRLSGIVSIGDVVKHRMGELEIERHQLESYIVGS
jgi:CBS domain-containing protein